MGRIRIDSDFGEEVARAGGAVCWARPGLCVSKAAGHILLHVSEGPKQGLPRALAEACLPTPVLRGPPPWVQRALVKQPWSPQRLSCLHSA